MCQDKTKDTYREVWLAGTAGTGEDSGNMMVFQVFTHLFEEPGALEEIARLASGCIFGITIKKNGRRLAPIYLPYLFCPGGADPEGFTFSVSVSCVSPPPVQDGCWPPGELRPPFVHPVSVVSEVIFADA
jgi:hypothetical protein